MGVVGGGHQCGVVVFGMVASDPLGELGLLLLGSLTMVWAVADALHQRRVRRALEESQRWRGKDRSGCG